MIILLTAEDTVASREANGEQSFSQVCNLNTVSMMGEYPLPIWDMANVEGISGNK